MQRTASAMSEPTLLVMASVAPSFTPVTAWLIWLMWLASSCASARVVMVGRMVSWGMDLATVMAFTSLRTDLMVAALVNRMQDRRDGGVAVLLMGSFSMLWLGSPGL